MNRNHVVFHLREAEAELVRAISEIESNREFGIGELVVAVQHLYHHVNTAWNGRNATEQQASNPTDAEFTEWSGFPRDLEMMKA